MPLPNDTTTNWPEPVDEFSKSHAGYVEAIKRREVRGAKEVFVIEAGMYAGVGCSLDVTALVYERGSFTRLGEINATPARMGIAHYYRGWTSVAKTRRVQG